jgi:superfamily II DNA helicase RecQ
MSCVDMEKNNYPKFSIEIKQSKKGHYYLGSLKVNAESVTEIEKLMDSALSSVIYKIGLLNESKRKAKKLQSEEPIYLSDSDDIQLFEKLRQWRYEVSQAENLPAYMIFHDSTLKEIALRRPLTSEELFQISGIGSKKYEKYGDILLKIVHEFTTKE